MRIAISSAAILLTLAACSGNSDEDQQPVKEGADSVMTQTPAQPVPRPTAAPIPTKIPTAMTGRWGLVPADCTSTRGDAKGLLVISEDQLKFYESVGKLANIVEGNATRIRANFDFTGEGMTWKREMALDVEDGGNTLMRQEFGEDAMPNPLKYSRC